MDENAAKIVIVPMLMPQSIFAVLNVEATRRGWTVSRLLTEAVRREVERLSKVDGQKDGK